MQIGPKIRIGGTVGKIGEAIKHHVPSVGGMIGSATGIPLGGLIGSAAQAKADGTPVGQQITSDFRTGAENTPFALAGTRLLGNGPDTSGAAGGAGGGAAGGAPDGGAGAATASASSIPGWVIDGLKTGLPAAVSWLKDNAGTILQGAGVADAAYREMQADKYATQAFKMAQDAYNAKAPLRSAGIAGMQAPTGNPFSLNQHTAGFQMAPPQGGPPAPGSPQPMAGAGVPFGTPVNFGRLTPLVPRT